MAVYEISTRNADRQRLHLFLDNQIFMLDLTWNTRTLSWTAGLYDSNGIPLVVGQKVVGDYVLFKGIRVLGMPDGKLVIIDRVEDGGIPGRNNFGLNKAFGLMYVETGV